jgi:1-acyl-sn-glycerol-3-phosphate acyltransferase
VLYRPVVTLVRTEYRHIERMPQHGPVILVANHVSHIDPFLLSALVLDAARTPRFLAKESIFGVPVIGAAMRWMGHIPVKRGSVDARQSLGAAVDALEEGGVVVLHPEGTVTRDPDGWPMTGRTGAARLATLVPSAKVVPLAQWGVQEQIDLYRKKVKLIPRPRHVISVGEPIDLSVYLDKEPTTAVLREMTEVIMRRLRDDVAELRGKPAPNGKLYRWIRSSDAA